MNEETNSMSSSLKVTDLAFQIGHRTCSISMSARLFGSGPGRIISVEGILAAGKSTFLATFENSSIELIYEPLKMWQKFCGQNVLDAMYCEPEKYTFTFQCLVLQTMARLLAAPSTARLRIVERSMYRCNARIHL